MTTQITLNLPDNLIEHARRFGGVTQRKLETVLVDALEMMWPGNSDPLKVEQHVSSDSPQKLGHGGLAPTSRINGR